MEDCSRHTCTVGGSRDVWGRSGYRDRSAGFRQGDPLRVSLKPFPGYMPCGQALKQQSTYLARPSPLAQPFPRDLLFWGVKCSEPHAYLWPPDSTLERTFSHIPLPHPCEPLSHLLLPHLPSCPVTSGSETPLGVFWASTSLASSHPVTIRVLLLSRKFSL